MGIYDNFKKAFGAFHTPVQNAFPEQRRKDMDTVATIKNINGFSMGGIPFEGKAVPIKLFEPLPAPLHPRFIRDSTQ